MQCVTCKVDGWTAGAGRRIAITSHRTQFEVGNFVGDGDEALYIAFMRQDWSSSLDRAWHNHKLLYDGQHQGRQSVQLF
jgi:hypothetical protein